MSTVNLLSDDPNALAYQRWKRGERRHRRVGEIRGDQDKGKGEDIREEEVRRNWDK